MFSHEVIGKQDSVKPVVIEIAGGIGNQLFSYFAGLSVAVRLNCPIVVDKGPIYRQKTIHEGSIEEINLEGVFISGEGSHNKEELFRNFSERLQRKLARMSWPFREIQANFSNYYVSGVLGYDKNLDDLSKPKRIAGYFQTYRYYFQLKEIMGLDLAIKRPSKWYLSQLSKIRNDRYVAVHIRRGDYIKHSSEFGLLSKEYYAQALRRISLQSDYAAILVFTDDEESTFPIIEQFPSKFRVQLVNHPQESSPIESLFLMSSCSSIVIANSTFSYWAAAMSNSDSVVYAPSKWFRSREDPESLIPEHWIRIPSHWEN